MKGICLRGQPGWGQIFRPADHGREHLRGYLVRQGLERARSTRLSSQAATEFYTKLVREHGPAGAAQAGFTECLNNMTQSKVGYVVRRVPRPADRLKLLLRR
jgi:sorbitol/mannitol transport system substrate-binding protein